MNKTATGKFWEAFAPHDSALESAGAVCIPSLTGAADAFLALTLAMERNCVVLAVAPGLPEEDRLAADLSRIVPRVSCRADDTESRSTNYESRGTRHEARIFEFPPEIEGDKTAMGLRFKTIAALKAWAISPYPAVIVTTANALHLPEDEESATALELRTGTDALPFSKLCEALAQMGYSRTSTVEREGDWSVRGGIVDFWSPGEESPVRAEFFGEDLESLRLFDSATQVSFLSIHATSIVPCGVRASCLVPRDSCLAVDTETRGTRHEARGTNLSDILPDDSVVLLLEHNDYDLKIPDARRFKTIYTGDPAPQGVAGAQFTTSPLPGFSELGAGQAHHPELFDAAKARLEKHVAAAERRGSLVLKHDDLSGGFEVPGLVVVTKADRVFTKRRVFSRRGSGASRGARINDFEELEPGEYVVHSSHGVGRFIGSSEITVDGKRSEVFTIEYDGGALLHVPAEHAHLITRYVGVKGEQVKLHRLDGSRWQKDREKAKAAVADLAAALLETQAKRETLPGFAYDVECEGLAAFEAAFPYEETKDQMAAIEAVKADLAKPRPMDRLICGDAGYGKTEVAMRAAFIAAMNGRQVALLAPTTVLAEQHFETFTSRFDGTPIRIEAASRIQSAAVREGTFKRLATGVCDIVIGTHAILSNKVVFHDLGLVIIDEEQRFGVRHKEHLKKLRATADVLTLSATPIPRTLYLSMTGARDLSLLRTPPRERVAVQTKIVRDDDATIRTAIDAEIARGGQVYFLHNRIDTIGKVEKRLQKLCPQAKITLAHGRMDAAELAAKVRDFELGKSDILLSTTIVESGIDIPRANTILIDRADTFGLADLYQLRGRVGRSSRQGYAFLLLPPSGDADSEARERLKALQRHGGLGAGFNLAVRDLELRGAGNLLGAQQSGHIAAIGFTLYCQLLQRTIAALRGEKVKDVVDVRLNFDFIDLSPADTSSPSAAALPYSYIEEDVQRLSFLRRFAEAMDTRTVKALADEMTDRFGKMPDAARRFVRIATLRVRCAEANIGEIDVKNRRAVFYRDGSIAHVAMLPDAKPDQAIQAIARELGNL